MRKLTQPEVNEICREMNVGHSSRWEIARRAGVTPRWVRELYRRYLTLGRPPERRPCGRVKRPLAGSVVELIKREHAILGFGAVRMEGHLLKNKHVKASHNKIHAVLKQHGLAKNEPRKQKQRAYVRYERHKANSLWHADWKELSGKHMILFEDDATRLITGYGLFDKQSAELSLQVFAVAVQQYGRPRQLLTDNGSEFCNTHDREDARHLFHKGVVVDAGVDHIFTRPSHPQCNGKLEKLNDTIQRLYKLHDGDLGKAVEIYNEKRIHMSLGGGWLTPAEAWSKKTVRGLKYEAAIKT